MIQRKDQSASQKRGGSCTHQTAIGRTRSFDQGPGLEDVLLKLVFLVRVTQGHVSVELGDLGEKWTGWAGLGGWGCGGGGRGVGVRRVGGAWCSEGGVSWDQQKLKRCDRGEGGVVSQVVMVIGQLTKCKDLFWSISVMFGCQGWNQTQAWLLGS